MSGSAFVPRSILLVARAAADRYGDVFALLHGGAIILALARTRLPA
ncbi:MAG: hypothetical protein LH485_07935 [Sphingomonas bacterium]|nr:hypothetical protein [Sphingomonas bacterium]